MICLVCKKDGCGGHSENEIEKFLGRESNEWREFGAVSKKASISIKFDSEVVEDLSVPQASKIKKNN